MLAPDVHPPEQTLADFLLGRLEDDEQGAVEGHLSDCPGCLARAAAARPLDTLAELVAAAGTKLDRERAAALTPSVTGAGTASHFAPTFGWSGSPEGDACDVPAALSAHPKYRVQRPLGHGGMGSVWLAEHAVMNRPVAVKVIRPELLARPGAAARFLREVRAAARLHHPNIVTAFDAEQVGESCLLVMEFIDGETLADLAREGPLPVPEACRAARDAARGLAAAHAAGLVHRDIKPHNLMRAADGTVKVLDFGLAGVAAGDEMAPAVGALTGAGAVFGTPDYIAPEQIADPHGADPRADIYALGCTLFHLLAGKAPFAGRTALAKLDAHRHADAAHPVPAHVPQGLAAVVAKMMARRPNDRYQTAAEVTAALEPFTRAEPAKPRGRKRWVAAAGLAVLFGGLAAAGTGWVIVRDKDGNEVARVQVPDGGKVEVAPTPDPAPNPPKPPATAVVPPAHIIRWTDGERFGDGDVSADGRFVTATRFGTGRSPVWDARTGKVVGNLGDAGTVRFAPDGRHAVTAVGNPTEFHVLEFEPDRPAKRVRAFKAGLHIWGFRLAGTGTRMMVWAGGRVSVWDWKSGDKLLERPWDGADVVTLTPDGKTLLWQKGGKPPLQAIDVDSGSPTDGFAPLKDSPPLHRLSADGARALCDDGRTIWVLDVKTGRAVFTREQPGHQWAAMSGNGRRVVTTANERDVLAVLDVDSGALAAVLKFPYPVKDGRIDVGVSGDGHTVMAAGPDESVFVFKLPGGAPAPEKPSALPDKAGAFNTFPAESRVNVTEELSADGRLIAMPLDGAREHDTLKVYETATGRVVRQITAAGRKITACVFLPGGVGLITAEETRGGAYAFHEYRFDGRPDRALTQIADPHAWPGMMHLSADGTRLALGVENTSKAMAALVVDVESGKVLVDERPADGKPGLAFARLSADGTRAATAVTPRGATRCTVKLHDLTAGKVLMTAEVPIRAATETYAVVLPDNSLAALSGADGENQLVRYDTATGKPVGRITLPGVCIWVTHPGRVATAAPAGPDKMVVAVRDTATGRVLYETDSIPGFKNYALSADGRVLAVRAGGKVTLYRVPDGPPPADLTKPGAFNTFPAESAANALPDALSPDGRLISVPVDGTNPWQVATFKVYDTATGRLVRALPTGGNRFTNQLFFPDGQRLITGERTNGGAFRFREWSLTGGPDRLLAHIPDPGGWPTFFELSGDGKRFSFSFDRAEVMYARVVDLGTGKVLLETKAPAGQKTYAYARLSADGTRALTAVTAVGAKTATVQLHDLKAEKALMTAEVKGTDEVIAYPVLLADGTPAAVVWTKDAGNRLERYDAATGKVVSQTAMPASINAHTLQPTRIATTAGSDRTQFRAVVLDPGTGRTVFDAGKIDAFQNQSLSADGRVMAVRGGGNTTVYRIPDAPPAPADLSKPGVLQYHPPDGRTLSAAQIAPDGRAFLVSRGDRTELFDTATGVKLHAFPGWIGCFALGGTKVLCAASNNRLAAYDRGTGKLDRTFAPLGDAVWAIFPVGPDAARVLVAVGDRTFRLFDVARGEQLLSTEYKGEPLYTFTADGKAVLIREPADTAYKAYDAATGKPVKGFEGLAARGSLGPFSADGTQAQSWDGKETRVVRVSDGRVVGTVPAHPDGAFGVGYTPDRTRTLIYRANGELELRDSITGAVLSALKVEFPARRDRLLYLNMSAVSPDGRFALLVATDGHAVAVRLPDPRPPTAPAPKPKP